MKILNSPQDFKRQLLNAIKNSKQTWLNCLYIGDQEFKEIIQENRGKLDIGMDYYRGNRQKLPMVQNVRMHYWKSPNYTLISQVLPKRWNETLGTFHCKGFVMDDQVILSGANLSADYFDNRQDRYILFKCKDLAQIYRKLFSQIHSTSYTMGENGEFISPEKGYEQLLEIAKELENNQEELQVLKKMETETTFIVPTLQMGALGIRQEELMLEWIFDLVGKQGGRGYLSSAYLNIPQRLCKLIQESRIKLDLLTSSPEANGFYGAQNVSKYLPDAYSYLELELLNSLKEKIQIYEYKRPGWTFHAKGFWANFTFRGNKWTVCTIGSSNFNSRSLNTDLESQAFLFTKDPSLSLELDNNRLDLFKYSSPVSVADLEKRQIKPLVKVAARLVRTWL